MAVETFQDNEILAIWNEIFSDDKYSLRIAEIQANYPQDRSLYIAYDDIDSANTDFAMYLFDNPDRCLRLGGKAIKSILPPTWEPANDINLRINGLPADARVEVRDLRSKHLGRLIAINGLVRKATIPKLKMVRAHFKCAKCDADLWVEQKGMYRIPPLACTNEGCNKGVLRFNLLEESSVYSDKQKIEIQESPEGLRGGAQPERISAYLTDDLAGAVQAGNKVTLNGIVRPVEKGENDKSLVFDVFIDVISIDRSEIEYEEIEITDEDEKKILEASKDPEFFNNLVKSIAPTIYGMEEVKTGLALQLFGGNPIEMDDGTTVRGDFHILMVGDPGVAKSQLISYMSRLAPRGVYASGRSATAAGLCVSGDSILIDDRGQSETIGQFVEARMTEPEEYRPGIWRQAIDGPKIQSISDLGSVRYLPITYVWKIKTPEKVYKITAGGMSIIITPETKLQAMQGSRFDWIESKNLHVGDMVSTVTKNMRMQMITEIEILTDDLPEYVYDLTIEPSHAFIASGFVVHNTAAAVKDDFGDGRWTLEAGALVLADKGLACIDELDKMTEQDRSSMHEAMESQTVTVVKAGINAKLQSRCSIVAAANPVHSRFVRDEKIFKQINLPSSLISRFDLVFPLFDRPEINRDRELTDYIISTHMRGQARTLKRKNSDRKEVDEILESTKKIAPVYSIDFIRKYVSYAKRNCTPIFSDAARDIIRNDYLNIRRQGDGSDSAVPITPRQLEAYIRLSEASARSRLSPVVEGGDASRASSLIKHYLDEMFKADDGTYDMDKQGDFSNVERKEIKEHRKLIKQMIVEESPMGVTVEEIRAKYPDMTRDAIEGVLKALNNANEIYENNKRWRSVD